MDLMNGDAHAVEVLSFTWPSTIRGLGAEIHSCVVSLQCGTVESVHSVTLERSFNCSLFCWSVKFITWKASHHSIFIQHPKKWSPNRRTLRDDKRAAEAHLPFSRIAKGFSGWVALEHKEKYGGLEQLRDADVMQCHANCFPGIGVHGLMTEPPGFALCFPFFWYSPRHLTRFLIFALALARQSIHRCEPQGGSAIAPWASASTSFSPRCNWSTGCGADACHCSTSNFRDSVKICQGLGTGCNPAISSL